MVLPMPCAHCPHCSAPAVLRLPRERPPADTGYDAAILAAYAAAARRSSQPGRLLREVNPWLSKSMVRDQLRAARQRQAERVEPLLEPEPPRAPRRGTQPTTGRVSLPGLPTDEAGRIASVRDIRRYTDQWPAPGSLVQFGLAADHDSARELLAAAQQDWPPHLAHA